METKKILDKVVNKIKEKPQETEKMLVVSTIGFIKMMANLLLENEVNKKVGKMYERNPHYSRWGTNPGSIWIDEEKIRIDVPRKRIKRTIR